MRLHRLFALGAVLCAAVALADPSGKKWQMTSAIPYRVFNHSAINCVSNPCTFSSVVLPAVQSGFERWTAKKITCTGASTGPTKWDSTYAGSFSSPSTKAAISLDNVNNVIWLGGAEWTHGAQTLGLTTTSFYTTSGQIIDGDMELNNGATWKVGGASGFQVDVESIVTHEAGHFLGLNHSSPTTAVMYAFYDGQAGEIKRALTSFDIDDVCTVYPGTGGTGGTLLQQGDACTGDAQCDSAKSLKCRGATTSTKICTPECSTSTTCPTGYTCQTATPTGSTGKACLPPVGAVDLCKFCTNGTQCSTGQCVTNGPQNWCTRSCMSAADCGSGYSCVQGTTSMVCVPDNNVCPTPQCTSAANCAVGYGCTGGMCTATGNPGDRCEVSIFCKACSVCVGNASEAYCRTCCASQGTGTCQGCPNPACTSGFGCAGVTGTNDAICYPEQGLTACQACDATTPCQSGYSCSFGRCHAACNPSSPGTCSACYDTGGGGGICACTGEVVGPGQSCGQLANGLAVCSQGSACVGTPKTCRTKCTLGNDATCQAGEKCTSVDGQPVCVPSNVAGERCSACTAAGACSAGFICVSGRCYEPCEVSLPECNTCVEAVPGVGICACGDQLSGPGQACGAVGGEVYACQQGAICVSGTCRASCDPTQPVCPFGEACETQGSDSFCFPVGGQPEPDAGWTPFPDAGSKPFPRDGGTGGPINNAGCGCLAGSSGFGLWGFVLFVVAVSFASRRRMRVS